MARDLRKHVARDLRKHVARDLRKHVARDLRKHVARDISGSSEFVNDGFVSRGTWKKFDIYMNGHRHLNHSKVACCP